MISKKLTLFAACILAMSMQATAQTRVPAKFVSGTNGGNKGETADMVADGLRYTKWCIADKSKLPYTVVLDAGKDITLSAYGLVTGDDTHDYPDRNPVQWIVMGSNDNKKWEMCDLMKRDRRMSDENEQEYTFHVREAKPYRYYQFLFTQMTDGDRIQLSEINLYTK